MNNIPNVYRIKAEHTVIRQQVVPVSQDITRQNSAELNNHVKIPDVPHEPVKAAVTKHRQTVFKKLGPSLGPTPSTINAKSVPLTTGKVTGTLVEHDSDFDKHRPINKVGPVRKSHIQTINNLQPGIPTERKIARVASFVKQPCSFDTMDTSAGKHLYNSELIRLKEEHVALKKELDKQVEVNVELKKLLIASLGDDLQYRLERLARDKAQLTVDVGDYNERVSNDYETLEAMTIQADMWRSKFLASRLMIDELANWKAHLYMQYKHSQNALQKFLGEQNAMKINLAQIYRFLKQCQNIQRNGRAEPKGSLSIDALSLSIDCSELAKSLYVQLSSVQHSGVPNPTMTDLAPILDLTPAEKEAHRVIASEINIDHVHAPESQKIERFHPLTRYENLSCTYCKHCRGETLIL